MNLKEIYDYTCKDDKPVKISRVMIDLEDIYEVLESDINEGVFDNRPSIAPVYAVDFEVEIEEPEICGGLYPVVVEPEICGGFPLVDDVEVELELELAPTELRIEPTICGGPGTFPGVNLNMEVNVVVPESEFEIVIEMDRELEGGVEIQIEEEFDIVEIDIENMTHLKPGNWDAENQKLKWTGWFEQFGKRYDMEFEDMQMDCDGNISGSGSDAVGQFTIAGTDHGGEMDSTTVDNVDEDENINEITFVKTYVGAHSVIYYGSMDGKKIVGTWEIPDNCEGEFEMKLPIKKWLGHETRKGIDKNEVEMYLRVRNGGVYGFGEDDVGRFYINGHTDPSQSCIAFTKSYIGQYQVHYNGSLLSKNEMSGAWVAPGQGNELHGWFDLK